jgi:hypothetical protein
MSRKPANPTLRCHKCGCPIDLGPDTTASCALCGSFAWSGTGPVLVRLKGPGRLSLVIGGLVLAGLALFLWAITWLMGLGGLVL